jgi:hypothetical protein
VEVLGYVTNIHGLTGRETRPGAGNAVFAVTLRRRGASVGDEPRKRSTAVDIALIVNELRKITARECVPERESPKTSPWGSNENRL